jgi:hypothetical protein
MQNFWELVLVLSSLTGQHTVDDVAMLTKTAIQLEDDGDVRDDYRSVEPIQLQLNSRTITATVKVAVLKKEVSKIMHVSLADFQGICLSHSILKERMTEFNFRDFPIHPVPDAIIRERAKFDGKLVKLGFKWKNPNCLFYMLFNSDD